MIYPVVYFKVLMVVLIKKALLRRDLFRQRRKCLTLWSLIVFGGGVKSLEI